MAEQIDAYLKSSPVLQADEGHVRGVVPRDDGKPHGVVEVGVGTGGYRSFYIRSDMPVGDSGRLSVAFADTRYGRGRAPIHGGGPWRLDGDQRCDLEGMTPPRPLDAPVTTATRSSRRKGVARSMAVMPRNLGWPREGAHRVRARHAGLERP